MTREQEEWLELDEFKGKYFCGNDSYSDDVLKFLMISIKKTREETIKEVEESIIRYQNGLRTGEYGEEVAPEWGVIQDLLNRVFPKEQPRLDGEQIPF